MNFLRSFVFFSIKSSMGIWLFVWFFDEMARNRRRQLKQIIQNSTANNLNRRTSDAKIPVATSLGHIAN
jgi:hypothetical protein